MNFFPVAWALPWIVIPVAIYFRTRNSRSLDEESDAPPGSPPLVSVIIPARNEARNIGRCVTSILASTYPELELIVVDDSSTDGTGTAAHGAAGGDARLRVITNSPLPDGWFGKQWACTTGAREASGEIILFTDADTEHAPDLIVRSVNAMLGGSADLFSVAGRQELGSFWEKIIQPQVLTIIMSRYGGTESVTQSPRVTDKIANGQCIFVRRTSYDEIGGHGSVRASVAEDLMLAQTFFRGGKHVELRLGLDQLSTRMYTSLSEVIGGWGKNVFAGGIDSVPFGLLGKLLFPFALLIPPLVGLLPPVVLLFAAVGLFSGSLLLWAAVATAASVIWWAFVYNSIDENPLYGLAYPLGAALMLYIFATAIMRGRRVTWKGRSYVAK